MHNTVSIVVLLASALFFTRWSNLYWVLPPLLAGPGKAGLLGGTMNFCTTVFNIVSTLLIGFIVQETGSYLYALIFLVRWVSCCWFARSAFTIAALTFWSPPYSSR